MKYLTVIIFDAENQDEAEAMSAGLADAAEAVVGTTEPFEEWMRRMNNFHTSQELSS